MPRTPPIHANGAMDAAGRCGDDGLGDGGIGDRRGRVTGLRAAGWAASGLIAIGASGLGLLSSTMPRPAHGAVGGATFAAVSDAPHEHELLVTSLRTGGGEEQDGLHVGDVIEAINGRNIVTPATLRAEEARKSPAILRIRRQGDVMTVRLLETSQEAMREQNTDRRGR